ERDPPSRHGRLCEAARQGPAQDRRHRRDGGRDLGAGAGSSADRVALDEGTVTVRTLFDSVTRDGRRAPAICAYGGLAFTLRRGGSMRWRQLARDPWGWRWLDDLACDARYACRVLVRRDRASNLAAVVILALAIGLNGIVSTIVDAMLVRGFPLVKDNDRLVMVQEIFPSHARAVSFPDFDEWRAHAQSLEGMCAVASGRRVAFRDRPGGRPEDLTIWTVTANTFGLLGVAPLSGRDFVRADEAPGASPVVILSHRFWATRFGKSTG